MRGMMNFRRAAGVLLICAGTAGVGSGQARRPRGADNPIRSTGAYNEPAATMHGMLKRIRGKDLLLTTEENQDVEIHLTRKTKYLGKDGREIKPSKIAPGSILSVDVAKAADLSSLAVNVRVDSPPVS